MVRRPLIWILGVWILGEIVAFSLGVPLVRETGLDAAFSRAEDGVLVVLANGTVRAVQEGASGVRLTLTDCLVAQRFPDGSHGDLLETHDLLLTEAEPCTGPAFETLVPGTEIALVGRLSAFDPPMNPGEPDYRLWYRTRGIDYRVAVSRTQILREPGRSARGLLFRLRSALSRSLSEVAADADEAGLFRAVLLGDRQGLSSEDRDLFRLGGIAHILAISGLHLSLIGQGLRALLRRLGAGIAVSDIAAGAFLVFYVLLIDAGPSALRALIMFLCLLAADLLGRSYDLLSALGLAGILLLAGQPLYALDAGFQLSFAAMAGIGGIRPVFERYLGKRRPPAGLGGLLAGLSVQLATLPLAAWHYHEISLLGILLNLAAVPLMTWALASVMAGAVFGLAAASAGIFFAGTAHYIFAGLLALCRAVSDLPAACVRTGRPSSMQMILWYLLLFTVLAAFRLHTRRRGKEPSLPERRKRRQTARRLLPILSLSLLVLLLLPVPRRGFCLTALYVGQGDGLVIEADGRVFVSDFGSSSRRSAGEDVLLPYLKYRGISRVDAVFLSHADEDHTNGIPALLADPSVTVGRIFLAEGQRGAPEWEPFLQEAENAGVPVEYLRQGSVLAAGALSVSVLLPGDADGSAGNGDSMVLLLSRGDARVLLTGDLGEAQEAAYAACFPDIDVLKTAHHGSRSSTTEAFLQAVRPELAVISCGIGNVYGHPAPETLARLAAAGAEVFVTADCGAVTLREEGGKWTSDCVRALPNPFGFVYTEP